MIFVAITMDDGSVRRMQCVSEDLIEASIAKTPWAARVKSWRLADAAEFPANCRWQDNAGRIVGVPIVILPTRDPLAEIDALKVEIATKARV
jgi:hypothetical protein